MSPDNPTDSDLAHPETEYQILPYDPQQPTADLPTGHGAIAVHAWCPPAAARYTLAPMIGVDGRPATYGWGRALIVVPAGERLVEVQYVEPQRSAMVHVPQGQLVPLEYAASYDAIASGSLGAPRQRPRGTTMPLLAALVSALSVGMAGCLLGFFPFALSGNAAPAGLVVGGGLGVVAGGLFFVRWRRRSLRRPA